LAFLMSQRPYRRTRSGGATLLSHKAWGLSLPPNKAGGIFKSVPFYQKIKNVASLPARPRSTPRRNFDTQPMEDTPTVLGDLPSGGLFRIWREVRLNWVMAPFSWQEFTSVASLPPRHLPAPPRVLSTYCWCLMLGTVAGDAKTVNSVPFLRGSCVTRVLGAV